jgi:hypothetical protein
VDLGAQSSGRRIAVNIDINEVAQSFKPWDLTLTIDGKNYKVRPLSIADRSAIIGLQNKTEEEGYQLIEGLFEGKQKPKVRDWDPSRAAAVLAAIGQYANEMTKKNAQSAAAHVESAMRDVAK